MSQYQSTNCSPTKLVEKFRKLFGPDHESLARSLGLEPPDIGPGYDDTLKKLSDCGTVQQLADWSHEYRGNLSMTRMFSYLFLPGSERQQTLEVMSSLLNGVTENNVTVERESQSTWAGRGLSVSDYSLPPIIRFSSIRPTVKPTSDEAINLSAVQQRAMCRSLNSDVPLTAPLIPDLMT